MPSKPQIQSFTQNWNKTVNWAKQNNIPYSAYYPVYQLDSQRVLTGSPMSESERIRAIEASAGLNYSTALPTDQHSWTDLVGNTVQNSQSIFTGLNPIHLVSNVFDTIKNTIEHPSNLYGPIGDAITGNMGAAGRKILAQNNILQWVPGVYDFAQIFAADPTLQSSAGFEQLARNPITSLLDIVPFGRVASGTLGVTELGAKTADRLGMTTDELKKLGIWRVGGKLVKTVPVPKALTKETHPFLLSQTDPTTGLLSPRGVKQIPTLNDFWEYYKAKVGASSKQADILESRMKANQEGTRLVEQQVKEGLQKLDSLSEDEQNALIKWTQTDFRPFEEKMADANVPLNIREAYAASYEWGKTVQQLDMQSGDAATVQTPWGTTETYYVKTDQYRNVQRALDDANTAQAARDKAAAPVAGMLYKMDENDRNMSGVFGVLDQLTKQVYSSIQRSIPHEPNADAAERLRSSLPESDRWTRWNSAVADQPPFLRNLFGLPPAITAEAKRLFPDIEGKNLTMHQINATRDLFSPGGLLEQSVTAYRNQDWVQLNKITKAAMRKFNGDSFKDIPKDGAALLYKIKQITKNLQQYAAERQKLAEEVNKRMVGYDRNGVKLSKNKYGQSVGVLSAKAAEAHQEWLKVAIHNPPDMWRNVAMDMLTTKLSQQEKTAAAMEDTIHALSRQGWEDSELTKLHRDSRTIMEIMTNAAKGSLENDMLPDIDHEEFIASTEDTFKELASLRARGEEPLYVHMLTPQELSKGERTYNVYIHGLKPRTPGGTKQATWGNTSSVYDLGAGMLERTKQMVEKDMIQRFIDQDLMPHLMPAGEAQAIIRNYFRTEIALSSEHQLTTGARTESPALTTIEVGMLDKFNLESFNPAQFFGEGFSHPSLNQPYLIDKDIAKAFKQTIDKFQFPAQGVVDRGTKLFRFSILGLSPRYTAHILFGGSYMVALRANPSIVKYMRDGVYFAVHGSFSDKTYSKFHPDFAQQLASAELELSGESTEEGLAAAQYHYVAMNSAGRNWLIPEWLSNHSLPDTYKTRIRAAADVNMRFTRAIRRAQNSMVYLDGASRALREGTMFYEDQLVPRTSVNPGAHPDYQVDEQGRNVFHPATKRQMHDTVRSKVPMTPQQAHKMGMDAVAEVMGNLRHMTPLERNLLARVFPFYGWTKHVLQYVLSYPFDHPYRAFIVSQLAMQNSQDVASGLPLRIELLTFLGSPDQYGNVTAVDTKALNPFRDTANYASLTGLFESLNPAITGFFGLVDPQASFAGQNLYPQVIFNSLYGVKTAGPGGNVFTAAEQFVPQLTAVDEAFNLSGQYAYLKQSNPQAFTKKIFESFGLPFTPEQLNLRQIAAKQEIDRYQIASNAAYTAATNPSSDALAGYPANAQIPDPLNTLYNVTPAYIAAMNQQSESQYGLPFYETTTPPRTPPGL
jgi:hypothetical protein